MVIRAIVFLLLYKVCSFLRVLGSSQRPVPVAVLPQSRREYIPVGSMAASMPPKLCATLPPALAKFRASRTLFLGVGCGCGFGVCSVTPLVRWFFLFQPTQMFAKEHCR